MYKKFTQKTQFLYNFKSIRVLYESRVVSVIRFYQIFFVVQEFYIPFEMCVYFDWSYTTQHKIQCDGEIYCQYTLFCIIISDFDYRQVGVNFFCTYSRLYKELATLTHPRHHIRNSWYKCMHKMFDVYVVFCGKNELFYFCLVKCIKKGLGF